MRLLEYASEGDIDYFKFNTNGYIVEETIIWIKSEKEQVSVLYRPYYIDIVNNEDVKKVLFSDKTLALKKIFSSQNIRLKQQWVDLTTVLIEDQKQWDNEIYELFFVATMERKSS